jgi:hypothetical protein
MALFFAAVAFVPAAQAQKPDYDRLKNILEDKFKPDAPAKSSSDSSTRSPAPSPSGSEDFEYVKPDADALKKKRSGGKPEGWLDTLKKKVWGKSSSLAPFASPATAAPLSGAAPADAPSEIVPVGGGPSDQGVPVAKKNIYFI